MVLKEVIHEKIFKCICKSGERTQCCETRLAGALPLSWEEMSGTYSSLKIPESDMPDRVQAATEAKRW